MKYDPGHPEKYIHARAGDTTHLQALIDANVANGLKPIYLPPGTYDINAAFGDSKIDCVPNLTLVGAGIGKTIIRCNRAVNAAEYPHAFDLDECDNVEICHMEIQGGESIPNQSTGIFVYDSNRLRFHDLKIIDCYSEAIQINLEEASGGAQPSEINYDIDIYRIITDNCGKTGTTNASDAIALHAVERVDMHDLKLVDSGSHALLITRWGASAAALVNRDISISHVHVNTVNGRGIFFNYCGEATRNGVALSDFHIYNCGAEGLELYSGVCHWCTITNGTIQTCGDYGLDIYDGDHITVSNVTIQDVTTRGVSFSGNDLLFSNVIVEDSSGNGFRADNSRANGVVRVSINGCQAHGNSTDGVSIEKGSYTMTDIVVAGGIFNNNGARGIHCVNVTRYMIGSNICNNNTTAQITVTGGTGVYLAATDSDPLNMDV